jgi:hypothetical protein
MTIFCLNFVPIVALDLSDRENTASVFYVGYAYSFVNYHEKYSFYQMNSCLAVLRKFTLKM